MARWSSTPDPWMPSPAATSPGVGVDRPPTAVRHLARLGRCRRHVPSCSCSTLIKTARELVRQTRNIGYETILGELDGGINAWIAAGNAVDTTALAPVSERSGFVLDVRQASEFATGHLPGAVNVELGSLESSSPPAGPISLMCGHGERAMTAASLLARAGRRDTTVLIGGPDEWAAIARDARDHVTTPPRPSVSGCAPNLAQFALLVAVNALVGGMIGQERTVLPLLAERVFGLDGVHRRADLHPRLRRGEGGHQLLRRHPVGPLRPQTRPRRRLAHRPAGAAAVDVGADLGLGRLRQRAARREPGPHLVDDGDHEDRPRRARAARSGHGVQRGRRLRRGRRHRARDRLHRRPATGCGPNRSSSASPTPRSAWALSTLFVRETHGHARHEATTHVAVIRRGARRPVDEARCSSSPASRRRPCRRRARPAWSTT